MDVAPAQQALQQQQPPAPPIDLTIAENNWAVSDSVHVKCRQVNPDRGYAGYEDLEGDGDENDYDYDYDDEEEDEHSDYEFPYEYDTED